MVENQELSRDSSVEIFVGYKMPREQAIDLSMLYLYRELDSLKERANKGEEISNSEKRNALNVAFEPMRIFMNGHYSNEKIKEIVAEWKEYFSTKHPDRYAQYNPVIEEILKAIK